MTTSEQTKKFLSLIPEGERATQTLAMIYRDNETTPKYLVRLIRPKEFFGRNNKAQWNPDDEASIAWDPDENLVEINSLGDKGIFMLSHYTENTFCYNPKGIMLSGDFPQYTLRKEEQEAIIAWIDEKPEKDSVKEIRV